jgi:hypothetical protein
MTEPLGGRDVGRTSEAGAPLASRAHDGDRSMTNAQVAARAPVSRAFDSLDYEASFLIEKLVKDRIVEAPEEAEALFTEVKRFIVIAALDRTKSWHMYSRRVDECWHQFILFTRQYFDFCKRYFDRYIPHSPGNAPKAKSSIGTITFEQFSERYEELFGTPLPDVWYDARNVTIRRRVLNDHAGQLTLQDNAGMVDLLHSRGDMLLSVNELARDALAFIARTGAFYVRELPGDLDDDEKIVLVATLVQCRLLRLAS